MAATVTVNDLLDGHVALDIECLDRIYLNGYVPNLQVAGQVVSFMTHHLGCPIPSPAIMEKIGTAFRRAVSAFAEAEHIPVVRFGKSDRKVDVMRRHVAAQAATGRSAVAAIGVAQEYQNVFTSTARQGRNGVPWFSFTKADRRVTCFYFYLWDAGFGPAFIKVCTYCPWPMKIYPLTELRRESYQFRGRVVAGGSTVAARDRIGRAAGSGGAGGASIGGFAGDGRPAPAVLAA